MSAGEWIAFASLVIVVVGLLGRIQWQQGHMNRTVEGLADDVREIVAEKRNEFGNVWSRIHELAQVSNRHGEDIAAIKARFGMRRDSLSGDSDIQKGRT